MECIKNMESSLIKNILPIDSIKFYHTYRLGLLIHGIIIATRAETYGEVACGFGFPMILAGIALRDNCSGKYKMWGIDLKPNRTKVARELLKKHGIRGDVIDGDAYTMEIKENVDVLFVDAWMRANQDMINKFAPFVNKAIILHDVNEPNTLNFPKEFNAIYIPESNCAIGYRNQ